MNGLADIHGISTHLNGECHFANQVTCIGADDAATQNLAGLRIK